MSYKTNREREYENVIRRKHSIDSGLAKCKEKKSAVRNQSHGVIYQGRYTSIRPRTGVVHFST